MNELKNFAYIICDKLNEINVELMCNSCTEDVAEYRNKISNYLRTTYENIKEIADDIYD